MIYVKNKPELVRVKHIARALEMKQQRSLAALARSLGMTPRTLQRYLNMRGASSSQIFDEIRCDLALSLLRETRFSVSAIAHRVGYTDISNFGRAFRRWTGVSPLQWRRLKRDP
ncbi:MULTISPECIES: helix-turn-helix domain-containing protein [unclassified Falsihalocynthiibacter]|uniref:helix-turn-helix domain-containing protein n=1 Tax=unclassified Falsihalocynthiibacter TaxID=2854191 RepID=UPI003510BCA0